MKIKKYHFSKGFIGALVLIIFMTWLVFKCVPLAEKEQDAHIRGKMERQRLRLAQEFDSYTPEDLAKLPKFDARKYALLKRNGHFWLIPRDYYGTNGFTVRVKDIEKLINKKWNDDVVKQEGFRVFMYSPQYYSGDTKNYSEIPCEQWSFKWNGILINIDGNTYSKKITTEQHLDVCLTALKILNEEIREIHFIN